MIIFANFYSKTKYHYNQTKTSSLIHQWSRSIAALEESGSDDKSVEFRILVPVQSAVETVAILRTRKTNEKQYPVEAE